MKLVCLNMNEVHSQEEVHELLKEQMHFPEDYGMNLEALFEMLTTRLEENCCVELTRGAADGALSAFERELIKVLEEAARSLDEREGKLYAVFEDTRQEEYTSMW